MPLRPASDSPSPEKSSPLPLFARAANWEHAHLARTLLLWTLLGSAVGIGAGTASALFLALLERATQFREAQGWLLWLLPLAGIGIGLLYAEIGKSVAGGNNLLLERIHNPEGAIPFRMAPLILFSTVITHLFGGSAGREGTAVQMGGAFAQLLQTRLRLPPNSHRLLLLSGIAGGFGSVFGTPLAGTVFALEVGTVGRIGYEGLIPCFTASVVGDGVCRAWGVHHTIYAAGAPPPLTPSVWAGIALAGVAFGLASLLFSELTHAVAQLAAAWISRPCLRPFAGGAAVIGLTYLVGTRDYLGLSLPLIARSFAPGGVAAFAFLLKLLFTAVTLGSGFKGGEVTPLFCIGATLGAALARSTGQPPAFWAALGFVAVFAGAANTPLACTFLAVELFGAPFGVPAAAACLLAYVASGHRGIYTAQKIGVPKSPGLTVPENALLRDVWHGSMAGALFGLGNRSHSGTPNGDGPRRQNVPTAFEPNPETPNKKENRNEPQHRAGNTGKDGE